MAAKPNFAVTPLLGETQITVANANRDGSGTITTLLTVAGTGGSVGCRVDQIRAKAAVSTTAGMVRLYMRPNNGATWRLWHELPVTQTTVSAGAESWEEQIDFPAGVPLPVGA